VGVCSRFLLKNPSRNMAWFVGLVALTVPAFGERIAVHESLVGDLSAENSANAHRAFDVLSMLKDNPKDVELQ